MDNCFTGQRDQSRQTTEKIILYKIPAGPVTECTFARCRLVHTSCLDRMTSRRRFRLALSVYGRVFYCVEERLILQDFQFISQLYFISSTLSHFWSNVSSPGQRRGSCGHVMALFDLHTKCARCREKGIGGDDCVLKKPCSICEKLTEDQKAHLATPKYRVRKESGQKKGDSPAHVAASDVTVLGKVERKGEGSSDRGETPPKKVKKTSHKSPLKKKSSKPSDLQTGLQTLDDKWSERFSRLEALFLSKSFSIPVEPVKNSDVPVTDRPFIPPAAASTSSQQQKSTGQKKSQKATQPVEAPGTDTESLPADQQLTLTSTSVRPQLHSPVPAMKPSVTSTGPTVTVEEPEEEVSSDRSSHSPDEGELSDRESVQEQEVFIEVDQELSADQSYQETLRGVRSFMAWNDIPEFDSASSSQDDNPFTGSRTSQTGKVSVKVPVDEWLCHKFEKLNLTLQEGYPTRNSETAGLSKE